MSTSPQDEAKIAQNIALSIEAAEKALQQALQATQNLGQSLAQTLQFIQHSEDKLRRQLSSALTGAPALKTSGERLPQTYGSQGLKLGLKELTQHNVALHSSLQALRSLHGSLPQDTAALLKKHCKSLDASLVAATHLNHQIEALKPEHREKLLQQNLKTAGLGFALHPESQAAALKATQQLDTTLKAALKEVNQLRTDSKKPDLDADFKSSSFKPK